MIKKRTPSTNPPETPYYAGQPGPYAAPAGYDQRGRRGPRTGMIVWGVIVTIIGLLIATAAMRPNSEQIEVATILILFAAGCVLLVAALIVAIRGRSKPSTQNSPPPSYPPAA